MILNVNTKALAHHANRLEEIHRSAMPVAIRNTLNSAAFDVKKNTMPASANDTFINRRPNFFKANSKVAMAQGLNVTSMKATVGFTSLGNNKAVDELKQQEHGGQIGGRAFIPMSTARVGANWNRNVRADFRMQTIANKDVIDANKVRFKGHYRKKSQRFVRAAIKAFELHGPNALVMGNLNPNSGMKTLSAIKSVTIDKSKGTVKIKRTPLYSYIKGRKVKIAGTNFMKRASLETGLKMEKYFIEHAEKQLAKYKK